MIKATSVLGIYLMLAGCSGIDHDLPPPIAECQAVDPVTKVQVCG
ncbi:hypothetical protein [Paracoccus saliphilus]|uniref:Lipoprotein n=1 Tax=Paracoccus saliphilus TaxID=405559 RepID=A0AA46A445_9RHOB|nr:hypothetical protein [Paracoccus saliphilus]SIS55246.1 hypothetical protein SAMN05421772_101429 [Paracoccus saliphilus]